MSDDGFFREVDEELRSDRAKAAWSRYGRWVIAAAVLLVLVVAGQAIYSHYETRERQAAGDTFLAAIRLLEDEKREEALLALRQIEAEGNDTYRTLARMRIATELAENEETREAVALYDSVVADPSADPEQRALARIRAGLILVDTGTLAEVEERMTPLAGPGAPYRHSAREILGLAHYRAGDFAEAFNLFSAVVSDAEAPQGVQQRSNLMLDVIASKGGPTRMAEPVDGTTTGSVPAKGRVPAE